MVTERAETRQFIPTEVPVQPIEIPMDHRGKARWSLLNREPEKLQLAVRIMAQEFLAGGGILTSENLRKANMGSLNGAIFRYYPGKLTGVLQDLSIEPKNRSKGYWKNPETIESATQKFISEGRLLTSIELRTSGHTYLERAIYTYYPGGLKGLRQKIGSEGRVRHRWQVETTTSDSANIIKRDTQDRVKWSELTPEQIIDLIEQEAQLLISQGVRLTQRGLHAVRREDLTGAIRAFYSGGFRKLKENLALPQERVAPGYWTPDKIRQEAQDFFEREGGLTQSLLARKRKTGFTAAIRLHYPGGFIQLKNDLGIELSEKPKNYWTIERIEQEAIDFATREGGLSDWLLEKKGAMSLRTAIQKNYPGKMTQLKINLGIRGVNANLIKTVQKPSGYWTPERIKQEALEFYQSEGVLSHKALARKGKKDLVSALRKTYPGGIQSLKNNLGIDVQERKSKNYWTPENMLREAKTFYDVHSRLAAVFMNRQGQSGLSSAITRQYPGGWRQLRRDLGIENSSSVSETLISPEQANEQLRRLLE